MVQPIRADIIKLCFMTSANQYCIVVEQYSIVIHYLIHSVHPSYFPSGQNRNIYIYIVCILHIREYTLYETHFNCHYPPANLLYMQVVDYSFPNCFYILTIYIIQSAFLTVFAIGYVQFYMCSFMCMCASLMCISASGTYTENTAVRRIDFFFIQIQQCK